MATLPLWRSLHRWYMQMNMMQASSTSSSFLSSTVSSKHDCFLVLSSHSQLINNPVRHPCIENVPKIINSVINGRCMHALRFNFPGHLIFQFFSLYISYACLFVHRFVKVVGENFVSLDYSTTIIMFNI